MSDNRLYTSRRSNIVLAISEVLKGIDGSLDMCSDVEGRVLPRLTFWDEIQEFPTIQLNAGRETRQYQGGGYKDRYMQLTIRCYVNEEESAEALDALMEDVETVVEDNSRMEYVDKNGTKQYIKQITIETMDSDEGALAPLGVGEIVCTVQY